MKHGEATVIFPIQFLCLPSIFGGETTVMVVPQTRWMVYFPSRNGSETGEKPRETNAERNRRWSHPMDDMEVSFKEKGAVPPVIIHILVGFSMIDIDRSSIWSDPMKLPYTG